MGSFLVRSFLTGHSCKELMKSSSPSSLNGGRDQVDAKGTEVTMLDPYGLWHSLSLTMPHDVAHMMLGTEVVEGEGLADLNLSSY